jgi:sporulation protein YlmC with PRC-barrel domain
VVAGAWSGLEGPPRVWLAGELIGMKVASQQGDSLGKIEDVVVHPGGDTSYAVLSFGGWLGMGDKLFAMPWTVLRSVERDTAKEDSERSLVLPLTKEQLKTAPGFDKKSWPIMANADWTTDIDAFYQGSANPNTRKPIAASARTSVITWKVSDLKGTKVETPTGDELGAIKSVAIDTNGRVSYVALSVGDRLVAVPWDSFKFSLAGKKGDEKLITLASNKALLEKAPLFLEGKEHNAEMCDPKFITRVHEHFSCPPYWNASEAAVGATGTGD